MRPSLLVDPDMKAVVLLLLAVTANADIRQDIVAHCSARAGDIGG